jgi:hypothetical protein
MAMALMGMMDYNSNSRTLVPPELTKEDIVRLKRKREEKNRQLLLRQGLKVFVVEGIEIVALNYKNALRKYKQAQEMLRNQGIEENNI